jgi:beta-1,4-mannosyl-glycoprotein beta-1,4-N-acetylglucosaminyltransferase
MFNDELDLLEIRLNHHFFVDRFILIESSKTYSGIDKPYYYAESKYRFAEFKNKIYHVMLDFPFNDNSNWKYEHLQRNVLRGMSFTADDVIIYTDADEILRNASVIAAFKRSGKQILSLQMELGFYYVNVRVKNANVPGAIYHLASCFESKWHMGKILQASLLYQCSNLYQIREHDLWNPQRDILLSAGWHFSNIGSADRIYRKLKSISHCDDPEFRDISPEKILHRKANLLDPLGRDGVEFEIHNDLPAYLVDNRERFSDYFY